MAEFIAGPTMVLTWTQAAATTLLAADYRACTWTPTVAYVDSSAGSDTHITRLAALKDSTCAITLVGQTAGTAMATALAVGNVGTLTIQPEGTASGKRKIIMPAICDGAVMEFPYAEIVAISVGFTGNGAFTDSAN